MAKAKDFQPESLDRSKSYFAPWYRYRPRGSEVDAVHIVEPNISGQRLSLILEWCGGQADPQRRVIELPTLGGVTDVRVGDWIVKDRPTGRFYCMADDALRALYEQYR